MYAQKTIKELQSMADEIKEQAKEFDYKGTAKQAGSMARKSLIKTIGFGIREAKKIINEAKEEASK